jgi:chromosome segregation ATPase
MTHSATLKSEQLRAEQLYTEMAIDVAGKTKSSLEAFQTAVRSLEIAQTTIKDTVAQTKEELNKSEIAKAAETEFPRPPEEELRAWASSAEVVHAMETEILALEREAQTAETTLRTTETETGALEKSIESARRRGVELETAIRSENAGTGNSEEWRKEKKKLEEELVEAEKKLNELRERHVAMSGNLQLARRRQTDIRVRGESTTSKHAVLEISVRSNLGQCYAVWDEKFQTAKTAEAHCLAGETLLQTTATTLFQDERNSRRNLLAAIADLKSTLTAIESELQ